MKTICLFATVCVLMATGTFAEENLLGELESVYLTVLADSVSVHDTSNRVYAVAMGQTERFNGEYIPVPDALWKKLAPLLQAKGIDPKQFVSPAEIGWKDKETLSGLVHKPTGKAAWVYSISGITWRGDKTLYVAQRVFHGGLAAGGCTLILEKKDGKWTIVGKTNHWVS